MGRLLSDVRQGARLVVEADDLDDPAAADSENLKAQGGSATLPCVLRTSHGHAHDKSITNDLHVMDAPPNAGFLASLIPRQHLVAILAGRVASAGRPPGDIRVEQFGESRQIP